MLGNEFEYKKATQALNYFAKRNNGKISKLVVLKLVWLADRIHLRKYGRPIFNDMYWAMQYGPVASAVKDIAQTSEALESNEKEYSEKYISGKNNIIKSIGDFDDSEFSQSDLDTLSFVYDKFGKENLVKASHEFPEWKKHENDLKLSSRVRMSYLDFFSNPEQVILPGVFQESAEELDEAKEIFKQNTELAKLWLSE